MGVYVRLTPATTAILRQLFVVAGGMGVAGGAAGLSGVQLARLTERPLTKVYPLLDRLERERIVGSRWGNDITPSGARRRLYRLTEAGKGWVSTTKGLTP